MEKKIAGLLGAMATLGAFSAAQAAPIPSPAPTDVLRANSFADLLEPIPNAAALLSVRVASLPACEALLKKNGVRMLKPAAGRLLVPPSEAAHLTLEFVQ